MASRRHGLDEPACLLVAQLLVDVAGSAVCRVDVEDDEVAALVQEVLRDGCGYGRAETACAKVLVGEHVADDRDALSLRVDVRAGGGDQPASVEGAVVDAFDDLAAGVSSALFVVEAVEFERVGFDEAADSRVLRRRLERGRVELHAQHRLGAPDVMRGENGIDVLRLTGDEGLAWPRVEAEQLADERRIAHRQCRRAEAPAPVHDKGCVVARNGFVEVRHGEEALVEVREGIGRIRAGLAQVRPHGIGVSQAADDCGSTEAESFEGGTSGRMCRHSLALDEDVCSKASCGILGVW